MRTAELGTASVAESFASVTSPDGTQFEVYDASTDQRTCMNVLLAGKVVRTFAAYGLAVEAIDSGLLDELIQLDEPTPPEQPAAITQRPEPATEQEITDLLATGTGLLSSSELDWRAQAVCRQADPEVFFPEKGGSTREAKKVCLSCPVRAECLDYALATDERFGIWGGLSERERRRVKSGTLDPQTVPLPAAPRRGPAPSPVVAADVVVEQAAPSGHRETAPVTTSVPLPVLPAAVEAPAPPLPPAGPVPCRRPDCGQLVTAEYVARTGEAIHAPCRALLAAATTGSAESTPVRRRRRSSRRVASAGGRS